MMPMIAALLGIDVNDGRKESGDGGGILFHRSYIHDYTRMCVGDDVAGANGFVTVGRWRGSLYSCGRKQIDPLTHEGTSQPYLLGAWKLALES